jgi:hypothetical protein
VNDKVAGMSLATDMLAAYTAAETAVLLGKEARLGDRSLRLEDLAEIRAGRKEWEAKVNAEVARARGVSTLGGLTFAVARLDGK